jgi:hypothetical protein
MGDFGFVICRDFVFVSFVLLQAFHNLSECFVLIVKLQSGFETDSFDVVKVFTSSHDQDVGEFFTG